MHTSAGAGARLARWALAAVGLATLQACATLTPSPDPRFELHIDNGTTMTVSIVVDGHEVSRVASATSSVVPLHPAPAGIVNVQARMPDGRAVMTFAIDPSTLSSIAAGSAVEVTGAAHRADLSCGRLDLWLLVPPLGPAPGPGTPGDCGQDVTSSAIPS